MAANFRNGTFCGSNSATLWKAVRARSRFFARKHALPNNRQLLALAGSALITSSIILAAPVASPDSKRVIAALPLAGAGLAEAVDGSDTPSSLSKQQPIVTRIRKRVG